jgi:hypothetical protein
MLMELILTFKSRLQPDMPTFRGSKLRYSVAIIYNLPESVAEVRPSPRSQGRAIAVAAVNGDLQGATSTGSFR